MRRVVCREFAPVSELAVESAPGPEAGPDSVVVAVDAAAVSFVDGLIVQGRYQVRPPLPYVPGTAIAGRVVGGSSVGGSQPGGSQPGGSGADGSGAGDRVAALLLGGGGWASETIVPAAALVPLPDGVDPAVAATALENYSTMRYALRERLPISPGQEVLVLGAGGGIGLAAVDVARAAGARVLAAASSEDKRAAALAAGAETAIGYDDVKDTVRRLTGGGADVVVDPVGGSVAEPALRALAAGGRYAVLGFAAGEIPRFPANLVLLRNRTVVGVDWGDWARSRPEDARDLAADVLAGIAAGDLHPPTPSTLPLDAAAHALARLAAREVVGKIALLP